MKTLCKILAVVLLTMSLAPLCACSSEKTDTIELNVYSWEDYISDYNEEDGTEDLIGDFEDYASEVLGKKVKVNYSTFGTNENMYNELQLSKTKHNKNGEVYYTYNYDLVCPSDYMIQKMIQDGMVEEFDYTDGNYTKMSNYSDYASPYIKDLFNTYGWEKYAVCYMWGTMGYVYNPDIINSEDAEHWSLLWNDEYKNLGTIKDSVRDSYALAVGYVYSDELYSANPDTLTLNNMYADGVISSKCYQELLIKIFNNVDSDLVTEFRNIYNEDHKVTSEKADGDKLSAEALDDLEQLFGGVKEKTVDAAGIALKTVKDKIYGYEVDSGKKDMASGKIAINFAWSGDAVYTLDLADEAGTTLYYSVPKEGSNIWFDGWVMPKGANKDLAQMFIDYISRPSSAISNMIYIGYTSPIGGQDVFDWIGDYYELDTEPGEDLVAADLSYFFPGVENALYYIPKEDEGRQFSTQYPTQDVISRCSLMTNFSNSELKTMNYMWTNVKIGNVPMWVLIGVPVAIILLAAAIVAIHYMKKKGIKIRFKAKNYGKLVSSREITFTK